MKGGMSSDRSMESTPHCTPSPPLQPRSTGAEKFLSNKSDIGAVASAVINGIDHSQHVSASEYLSSAMSPVDPSTNELLTLDVRSHPGQLSSYPGPYNDNNLQLQHAGPPTFGDSVIDTRFLDSPMPENNGSAPVAFSTGNYAFNIQDHHRDLRDIHPSHPVSGPRVADTYLSPPYDEPYRSDWMDSLPMPYPWSIQQQLQMHHAANSGHRRDDHNFMRDLQDSHLAAIPTVLEKFPGFVRCVVDIAPEVVGWVIGRSGSHIKEMKHRSGCGMWVDQKDLKLYITGADMMRINVAAEMVGDLILKAPVNVSAAGVENGVVSHMIDCPPHLIGLLIGRGGTTIKRIKEESRANVVINQKMMKVIVSGIPRSVRHAVNKIEEVFNFGKAADDDLNNQLPPPTPSSIGRHHFAMQHDMSALDTENYGMYVHNNRTIPSNEEINKITSELENMDMYGQNFALAEAAILDKYSDQNTNASVPQRLSTYSNDSQTGDGMVNVPPNSKVTASPLKDSPESQESVGDWSVFSGALFAASSSGPKMEKGTPRSQLAVIKPPPSTGGISSPEVTSASPEKPTNSAISLEEYLDCIPPGLAKYSRYFQENEIDVEAMHLMGVPDFVEIGIPKGPAVKIAYVLKEGCIPPGATYPLSAAQFLDTLGLSKYAQTFQEAEVDLPAMAAMRDQDFAELGLVKGPRLKIMAELRRLFTSSSRDVTRTFWAGGKQLNGVPPNLSMLHSGSNDLSHAAGNVSGLGLLRNSMLSQSARLPHRSPHMSP